MRNLTILLCACLGFSSCERYDGETVVEGQVVGSYTGEPISNATVTLYSSDGSTVGGAYNGFEFNKQTDDKGNFSFGFEADSKKSYAIRAFKEPGYYTAWQDAISLEDGRNNKKLKLKMIAPAWVKVKLVNNPPKDKLPYIYVRGFSYNSKAESGEEFYNLQTDTTFIRRILANIPDSRVIWRFNQWDANETFYKEITATSLDTIEVVIEY